MLIVSMDELAQGEIIEEIGRRIAELGLPAVGAQELYSRYGSDTISKLHQNPFQVASEVQWIGFHGADHIARTLGRAHDHEDRIVAGILLTLEQAQNDGHCALPRSILIERTATLLHLAPLEIEDGLKQLGDQGRLVEEDIECGHANSNILDSESCEDLVGKKKNEKVNELEDGAAGMSSSSLVFALPLWQAEFEVAHSIAKLCRSPVPKWSMPTFPCTLAEGQRSALEATAQCKFVVITGAPGTGKSTIVQYMMHIAEKNGVEVMLAAPTGRAAKRLEQSTGASARTIHRLLEAQGKPLQFGYHENRPLPPGLLVVDESSMIDMPLARALLASLNEQHRVVFLGDVDQLPSVGPGQFLSDLLGGLESMGELPSARVVRLSEVFRQSKGSAIVERAHQVLRGEMPFSKTESFGEGDLGEHGSVGGTGLDCQFVWIRASDPQMIHDKVIDMVTREIPRACGMEARKDIQVLCPMHGGLGGTTAINQSLQIYFSKSQAEFACNSPVERWSKGTPPENLQSQAKFFLGDRVMQVQNDYGRGIFNGEVGTVVEVGEVGDEIMVDFEGRRFSFQGEGLSTLQLAYAVTIHKSQGNEFPAVVIPLMREHQRMLQRNLLYTAMTRAISRCVIVGDALALRRAVRTVRAARRHTGFLARLREELLRTEGIEGAEREG